MQHRLSFALTIMLLTACGSPEDQTEYSEIPAADETNVESAPTSEAAPIEPVVTLGSFDTEVTDLSAWQAPTFGFQSQIYAANGANGITAVQPDGAGASTIMPTGQARKLAVAYASFGGNGALLSLSGEGRLDILSPDGSETYFAGEVFEGQSLAMCAGELGAVSGMVIIASDGTPVRFELTAEAPAPVNSFQENISGAQNCAFVGGQIYFLVDGVWVTEIDDAVTGDLLVETEDGVMGIGIDGDTLSVPGRSVRLVDTEGAPVVVSEITAAQGNFGGVLRNGGLAVLDENRNLHMYAWSAVADALALPRSLVSYRAQEEFTDSPIRLGEDVEELTPQRELPGFEPVEPEGPPNDQGN